jgi:hypothetical protein
VQAVCTFWMLGNIQDQEYIIVVHHSKTLTCNLCIYAFFVSLKEAHLCDWPHKARCKSGAGDVKPTDLPTVRPTPAPTQPALPPASSTQGTLSSSGEVVSSTAGLPTVEPVRPPQSGTLSGNHVHVLHASDMPYFLQYK